MKKIYIGVLILTFISLLAGCADNKKAPNRVEDTLCSVDMDEAQTYEVYDFFSSMEILELENSPESLISQIDQVVNKNDKYYVLDGEQDILFVFDNRGKFLFKINRQGRSPNEYHRLDDFIVEKNGNIVIYDTTPSQLLWYDSNGKFLKSEKNEFGAYFFEKLNQDVMVYSAGNSCNETFCSKIILKNNSNRISNYIDIEDNLKSIDYETGKTIYRFNNNIRFLDALTQTVYEVSKDGIERKMKIDFLDNNIPAEFLYNKKWVNGGKLAMKAIKEGYAFIINDFIENEDIVFFSFVFKERLHFYFKNKMNKEKKIASYPFIFNSEKAFITNRVIGSSDDSDFVMSLNANQIKNNIDAFSEEQKIAINNLEEDANPVLVKYNFQ